MKDALYPYIGHQIQRIRQRKGFTQSDLAEILGLSRSSVVNIEQGRQTVMLHSLLTLADKLHVDLLDFLPPNAQSNHPKEIHLSDVPSDVSRELAPGDLARIEDRLSKFLQHENS